MSDDQTLLAVIAAIYLIDCVYWVPQNALSVTRWLRNPWKLRFPASLLGNSRGALGLANPIPPLGLGIRCLGWPLALSPEGIYSAQTGKFLRWTEVETFAHEDRKLLANGSVFHKAPSGYSARYLSATLSKISKSDPKKREIQIASAIAASCDVQTIRKQTEAFKKASANLRLAGNFLFFFLFGACPFLAWRYGLAATIWPMVIGIYFQTIAISLLFSKLHREIYPDDSAEIFKPFLTMLLAAPSAIRAQDLLARPLLENFHPLVAAKALCSEKDFQQLAPTVLRDLHFPRNPLIHHEQFFREKLRETLISKLQLASKVAEYLAAPKATETIHTAYCPRCLQQFTAGAADCNDCGGRKLLPL